MTDETLFAASLESPDRGAFLAQTCPDAEQRARVERLLAAHDRATGFLQNPAAPRAAFETRDHVSAEDHDLDDSLGFLTPPARPDSLGRIGHYEVLEVLGRGGFGIVFRAFDETLQRVVAVKVLAPSMAATSPARKRFLREARSSAAIRHENVVQVHAVEEQPLPHIVMEFVPGESLQQRLDRAGPLEVPEVLRIGRQVAEGLAAAHATGVVHRDIKPANILVEPGTHRARITDFGLARAADDASLTRSGTVAGTPLYMAPEQAKGESLDHRADLFSLGSVLYAVLTGRPPFRADTTLAVLKRVADDTPRPIREVIPEVPEWLCRIVEKLHAKTPADRYQTAREVADVLADCERQLAAHKDVTDFSRIPDSKPVPRRRSRRLKWAAVVVVLAGLFAWFARPAQLYANNQAELVIEPGEGLVSVIVLKNDEGVIDGNKLHPLVTDWLGMKKPQRLKLPPGKYQLNVGTYPSGTEVSQWEVTAAGAFGSTKNWVAVERTSAIITVERGQRVTLRPKMWQVPPRTDHNTPVSPAVPKHAADILAFIRGSWKGDRILVEPKPPADKSRSTTHLSFEPVAGGKVMRGLAVDETGRATSIVLHSYASNTNRLSSWYFGADGESNASDAGAYDPSTRTFHWKERPADGTQADHHMTFVDGNTVSSRHYDTDATSKLVFESQVVYTRTNQPAVPKHGTDAKRPSEMAALNRLVGEWRTDLIVKAGASAPEAQVQQTKASSVLGGRFVEITDTDEATGASDYAVAWYDAAKKQYRQWFFHNSGYSFEMTGTWDEAAKTLTWASRDNRLEGRWVFKPDGTREFLHKIKDGNGNTIGETSGRSRRAAPAAGKPEPVVLKRFDPEKDRPTLPWGDPKNVRPEDGGWRIENATNMGNFRAHLGTLADDLPTEGLIVFRAKVKVKANDKLTWGGLQLGIGGPKFHGYDWPEERGTYRGDVPEWTEKELRYPASVFHKENPAEIPVYVGMYSNGVVWVKDAEVLHIPVDPQRAAVLNPLRDAVKAATGTLALTKKRYEAGTVNKIELLRAEGHVIDARVAYAEAEGDAKAVAERLGELVKACQEERDLIEVRVKAGAVRGDELTPAEVRLAQAKVRLAKAKPGAKAGPDPAVVEPLRDAVKAVTNSRDLAKKRFDVGTGSKGELLRAEAELIDARIALAEAEGDAAAVVARLEELVKSRQEERDLTALRVEKGGETTDALNQSDAKLAEAKVRLAKAKAAKPQP